MTASPRDWYDPAAADNWQKVTLHDSDPSPPPAVAPDAGPPIKPRFLPFEIPPHTPDGVDHPHLWKWKVVTPEARALFDRPPDASGVPAPAITFPRPEIVETTLRVTDLSTVRRADLHTVAVTGPAAAPPRPVLSPHLARAVFRRDLAAAALAAGTLPLIAESLQLDFDLCVVRLRYDWLDWSVFDLPGWYTVGFPAGAMGRLLPAVPIAAVIARDTVVVADLNDTDDVNNLAAFGPFQLDGNQSHVAPMFAGGFHVTRGYKNPQLIGWIGQVVPSVPPESDPSLPPA